MVVDGVKKKEQFDYLSKEGSEFAEGPYFSSPLSEEEAISYYKKNKR